MRRAAVGVLAGTLTLTGATIAAGVSPANAVPGFTFERLAGADRYATAAAIARDSFPDGADTAIIARGDVFADALTANYLAGTVDAPILLTASGSLPRATAAALTALGVDNVIIVGGTTAVSAAVEAQLNADYDVERLGGSDRYLTAELIAQAAADEAPVGEFNGLATAVLASGQDFPDALALGPIAYAGNHPLLLTRPGDLPASTESLLDELGIEQVVIAGLQTAVSTAVEDEVEDLVGADAIRLGGQTRFETATIIAEAAYASFGFDETHVNLARGDSPTGFADALTGGPHAGRELAPIVLTNPTALPPATEAFLEDNASTLEDGHIFGGFAAVSAAVEAAAEAAAQGEAAVAPVALTAATVAQGGALTGTLTGDFSAVTVSGCGFTDQAIGDDDNATTAGRQFTLNVAAAQATGACNLVFTFTPTGGGATFTQTVPVTVTTPPSNQTFTVTPSDAATLRLANEDPNAAGSTAAIRNADNRVFSVSGLTAGTTYRITLVDSANIQTSATGVATFRSSVDAASRTGFSANIGTADNADIVRVNNAAPVFADTAPGVPDTAFRTTTAQPVNGTITFEIDGTSTGSVTPVFYINGGPDNTNAQGGTSPRLEVTATAVDQFGAPIEPFGLGGRTTFAAQLAGSGAITAGPVTAVDKDNNAFETGTGAGALRFTFDANDVFTVDGLSVGLATFKAALSSGDNITGSFTVDAGGVSTFALTDTNPTTQDAPTADRGTGANARNVTVNTGTLEGDVDQVVIQRANVAGSTVGTFVTIATVPATDVDTTTTGVQVRFVDMNLPNGTFQYRVAAVNDGDQGEFSPASGNVVITDTDSTVPTITDLRVGTNLGNPFTLEAGDTFLLVASEVLAAPTVSALGVAGDAFRVTDGDGTVLDLINGTDGVTFALNNAAVTIGGTEYAAGRVLTVTVGTGTSATIGTIVGLNIPATITSQSGTTDLASNPLALTGDTVIDTE